MGVKHFSWECMTFGLTHKNLSLLKVMFIIKIISILFFHGSKQKLRINKNALLFFKNIT
jgi:hypothetical protein